MWASSRLTENRFRLELVAVCRGVAPALDCKESRTVPSMVILELLLSYGQEMSKEKLEKISLFSPAPVSLPQKGLTTGDEK